MTDSVPPACAKPPPRCTQAGEMCVSKKSRLKTKTKMKPKKRNNNINSKDARRREIESSGHHESIQEYCENPHGKEREINKPFLYTVYEQSTLIYISFVNLRFNVLFYFAANAVLFHFLYTNEKRSILLTFLVSSIGLFFTWIIFLIDKRNAHVFKRACQIASRIEKHYKVPESMQLHDLYPRNKKDKYKFSHSFIIILLTIFGNIFWIGCCVFFCLDWLLCFFSLN